jgi:N4-gp56 family major capsid protein
MADMGLTEVSAAVMKEVSTLIQAQLIQQAKLIPTVQNFPVAPGRDTVKIPRAGGFTADNKAENTALTAQVITYATDDLVIDKHKAILVRLEDIAQIQATPNVVADIVGRISRQLALAIDTDLVAAIEAASASSPDHRIVYANNGGDNTLGKADLLEARRLLHVQNVPFSECFIGVTPKSEVNLLAIDDFVHVDKYGASAEGLMNGELGRLYGARVIMSNEFEDLKTMVWHPTHVAFGMQAALRFEQDRDLANVATLYLATQLYGCKTLDSGKRAVLLGTAS